MNISRFWCSIGACLLVLGAAPVSADQVIEEPSQPAEGEAPQAEVEVSPDDPDYDPRDMRTDDLDDEIARGRFATGQSLYEAGRYVESAQEFESAYALSPRSSLLFNAYLAWRDAGRLGDAVRTLGLYLDNTPAASDHSQLSNRLRAMRQQLAADRAREDAENQAAEAERLRLEAEAEAERARAEQAQEQAREIGAQPHPAGYVVTALGAAMLVGGGVLAFVANGRANDLEDACPNRVCPTSFEREDEVGAARRMSRAADSLMLGSIGVLAAGVIMIFTVDKYPSHLIGQPAVEPTAGCSGQGCSVGLRGQF